MRTILKLLGRLLLVLAWTILFLGAGLVLLEESGVLNRALRASLAWRLGPMGEGLEVGRVSLRWFEPGIELYDIRLSDVSGGTERSRRRELLRLGRVHFSLDPNLEARPLRLLHVDGGRIRISNDLLESLNRFAESWGDERGTIPRGSPPPLLLTNFAIDVELPGDETLFRVGTVDLLASPGVDGGFEIQGELRPTFSGAVPKIAAIQVAGSQREDGVIEVRAHASDLPLETKDLVLPPSLGPLPIEAFAGRLSLEATGYFSLDDSVEAHGRLQGRLDDGRLQLSKGGTWLENLSVAIDSDVDLSGQQDLWRRELWDTVVRIRSEWGDRTDGGTATPFVAWGLFGKRVPSGAWARCFARAAELPISVETLRLVTVPEQLGFLWEGWDAYEPEGWCDVTVDSILGRESLADGSFRYPIQFATQIRHVGRSSAIFHGYLDRDPAAPPGERLGLEVPFHELHGNMALTYNASREGPWRMAVPRMRGTHSAGELEGWGMIVERFETPAEVGLGLTGPFLDFGLELVDVELDDVWQSALRESSFTRDTWADYNPTAGTLSASWRFREAPGTNGLTAQGDLEIRDASLAWTELPIPMTGTDGLVRLRWAERAARFDHGERERQPGEPWGPRAMGVAWDLTNLDKEGLRGTRARVRGFARDDDLPESSPFSWDYVPPTYWALDVDIDEIGLRGQDSDYVAAYAEPFAESREDAKAKGRVRVHYESAVNLLDAPLELHLEIVPIEVEVTPKQFPRRTTDVEGRVLIRYYLEGENEEDAIGDNRIHVVARWPRDVELAISADEDTEDLVTLVAYVAGTNPDDPGLKGALVQALAEDDPTEPRVDLSETTLEGAVDFEVLSIYEDETDDEGDTQFRLYPRGCSLLSGSLRLEDLQGALDLSGDVLRSPLVSASIAGHPVSMRDVVIFPMEDAASVPDADPLLLRSGFLHGATGLAMQSTVDTIDLPLDLEHLASLLEPEALATLGEDPNFDAFVDLVGARVLSTSPDDEDEGVVVLSGLLQPHDLALRFGLPIEVRSADLNVRELVIERGGVRAWAEIENLNASLADRSLVDASMNIALVDGRLTVDDLDGAFVGGRLRSLGASGQGSRKALGVDLTPPYRFDVALAMQEVHVDRLLRGIFQSSVADAGFMNMSLQLAGTPDDVLGLRGRGQIQLTEGRLWSIPAMRALFTRLGFPNTGVFDQLETRFEVRDGVIDTHHVLVKSNLLKLYGGGTLDLDGELNYDLDVRYSLLDRLGILNRLIYWLNRSLIRVAIRGDFERPDVLIRSTILELFKGKPDTKKRGLPLPPFAPLGPRF